MRRIPRAALLCLSACLLFGLASCKEVVRTVPTYIEVQTYKSLPHNLLAVPKITYPKDRSSGEVLRAYNFNTPQLEQCILTIEGIVELQPQK